VYEYLPQVRATQLEKQQRDHESTEKKRAHIQAFVDKNRASAAGAKMAQSRIKALERMGSVGAARRLQESTCHGCHHRLHVHAPTPEVSPPPL
jgi:ATP-binding cassette subfamily F protein 3